MVTRPNPATVSLPRAAPGQTPRAEIEKMVREEMKGVELRSPGRCTICRNPDILHVVNQGLANGLAYAAIARSVESYNQKLPKNARVTRYAIQAHSANHFDLTHPSLAVYRRIVERRAAEVEQDWVNGVGSVVTTMAYLEVVGQKGFEALMEETTEVSPELGMQAMLKLNELTRKGSHDAELAELRHKVNSLGTAVRDVVPEEYWPQILARMEELNGGEPMAVDVEVVPNEELAEIEAADDDDYDAGYADDGDEPDISPDIDDTLE